MALMWATDIVYGHRNRTIRAEYTDHAMFDCDDPAILKALREAVPNELSVRPIDSALGSVVVVMTDSISIAAFVVRTAERFYGVADSITFYGTGWVEPQEEALDPNLNYTDLVTEPIFRVPKLPPSKFGNDREYA